jgi:hypothetical protein
LLSPLGSLMVKPPEPGLGASMRTFITKCCGRARAAVPALWLLVVIIAMPLASAACAPLPDAKRPVQAPDMTAAATEPFEQGVAKYEKGDLAGALVAFRESQKLAAQAGTLWNIAVIELKLGLSLAAHADLREYLSRWPGAKHAAEAQQQIAALEKILAHLVVVNAPASATLTIEGQRYPIDTWLWPGTYTVQVGAPGWIAEERKVTLSAGAELRETFELALAPLTERTRKILGWTLNGGGAVLLGISGIFGIQTIQQRSKPDPDNHPPHPEARSSADIATILACGGVGLISVGLYYLLIAGSSKLQADPPRSSSPGSISW